MCSGMFARSIADLSAMCVHYGVALQMYFLFNESLIPRARNYCCDEFMRSDATHMMFIDADIGFNPQDVIALLALQSDESPYDVIGGPYPKKSHHKDNMILTEDGEKTIKELVESKYSGKVASLGPKGKIEWKQVLNHSVAPHLGEPWVKIQAQNQKGTIVTADHELAVLRDVLKPFEVEWVEAKHLEGLYVVRVPNKNSGTNNENAFYNEDQLQCLIGTLLGDGSIDSKGYLKFGHSVEQNDYLKFKEELFGGKISKVRKSGEYKGKEYFSNNLHCPRNEQIIRLRELFYPNQRKSVKNVLNLIDERSLAFWYMDDGSVCDNSKNTYHVKLCTESFGQEENELLVTLLKDKFDIESGICFANSNRDVPRIYIRSSSQEKFFRLISPYIIPSMEYKIPEKYRSKEKYNFNFNRLDICAKPVFVSYDLDTKSDQYDIEVADNHNMISFGYVESNCIAWEKIKMAVDKGFADEDPGKLDAFVGDYVFNPKGGQTTIPLNQPVEVLEIGTGFMMMRRKTFQTFVEKFPQYSYKPDHVRTEHFDGSREIMMYFQSEIDPKSKRYLSEDYWFTQKVQEIGMKVWLCPWMKLQHVGTMVFGGSLADLAALGASATADAGQLDEIKKRKKK